MTFTATQTFTITSACSGNPLSLGDISGGGGGGGTLAVARRWQLLYPAYANQMRVSGVSNTNETVICAVYSDNGSGSAPQSLLVITGQATVAGATTVTLPIPTTFLPPGTYWLAFQVNASSFDLGGSTTQNPSVYLGTSLPPVVTSAPGSGSGPDCELDFCSTQPTFTFTPTSTPTSTQTAGCSGNPLSVGDLTNNSTAGGHGCYAAEVVIPNNGWVKQFRLAGNSFVNCVVYGGLYTDNGSGAPGTLVSFSSVPTTLTGATTVAVPLPNTFVTAGTYWGAFTWSGSFPVQYPTAINTTFSMGTTFPPNGSGAVNETSSFGCPLEVDFCSIDPTATNTPTVTNTDTPTVTPTNTPSNTPTVTLTPIPPFTPIVTPTCVTFTGYGKTNQGAATDNIAGNALFDIVSLSSPTTLYSFSAYTTGTGNIRMAVYTNNGACGGGPDVLLAQTGASACVNGGWTTLFVQPTALSAGNYWIGLQTENTVTLYMDSIGSFSNEGSYTLAFGPFPSSYPSCFPGYVSDQHSMYFSTCP